MNEYKKIDEALYFMNNLWNSKTREIYEHNLSAFLSAARTVLQYALEEVKTVKGGKKWYDDKVAGSKYIKYFKEKRNVNIHERPIALNEKEKRLRIQTIGAFVENKTEIIDKTLYYFDDWLCDSWDANEDVMGLCRFYVQDLEEMIIEGMQKGYITG